MSVNGGGGVNPLSASEIGVFFLKEKKMQKDLKRKIMYLEGFQVIKKKSLKTICFRPFWIYWYANRKMILKKHIFFVGVRKKRLLTYVGGGSESYGYFRN